MLNLYIFTIKDEQNSSELEERTGSAPGALGWLLGG